MLSKNIKRSVALGMSLSTLSVAIPLIISSIPAYADEKGEVETQFDNASDNLKGQLDSYNYSADTQKEDIDSILSGFSYITTTGSAVTIKAKECENFSNENSTCSFEVRLYNKDDPSSNKLVPYSYTYNQVTTGSAVSLMLMSNAIEWTSTKSISTTGDIATINGIKFKLIDSGNKYVSVSGYTSDMPSDLSLPSKIKCGSAEYSVKGFENFAFAASNLTSIEIPNSITSIEYGTFMGCEKLESVQIPNSVTSIGMFAFSGCKKLTGIYIPKSVTNIEEMVFEGCTSMTAIDVAADNTSFKSMDGILYNKAGTLLIAYPPNKISTELYISASTQVDRYALNECKGLAAIRVDAANPYNTSIAGVLYDKNATTLIKYPGGKTNIAFEVPSSVTLIKENGFASADKLQSVKITGNVNDIGSSAFQGCSALKNVEILDGVSKSIDYYAFNNCSSLESINIPQSVTSISYEAFNYCNSLKAITVDSLNPSYKSSNEVLYSKDGTKIVQYPAGKDDDNYVIDDNVKTIGQGAFFGANRLKSITIPNGVTSLDQYAFYKCDGLTNVKLPNTVTTINLGAFQYCSGLTNVIIPDSVTNIGQSAFANCMGLSTVFIPKGLTNISTDAFRDCDGEKLSVFTYEISKGEITINGIYGDNIAKDVIIPYSIDGIKVTGVAEDLFDGATDIKSITCYNPELNKKIQALLKNEGEIAIKGISAAGYDGKFDGKYHSITVDAPTEFSTTYSTSENGVYSETNPSYKDKGSYIVYYKVSYGSEEVDKGSKAINIGECTHVFGDWIIRKAPTYTEKGEKYRVCSICNEEQVEEIPILTYINQVTAEGFSGKFDGNYHSIVVKGAPEGAVITYSTNQDGVYSSTNPSYKNKGIYKIYYKVTHSGYDDCSGTATISIGDCEHQYGDWIVRKAPTYTEKGEKYRVCSICNEEQIEEIPMLVKGSTSIEISSSSSSSNSSSEAGINSTEIVIKNSNDEVSIIDAINSKDSNTIVINLEEFNNVNSGVFLSERILNALKANSNKTLVIKIINNDKTITNVEVKSTVDGQIQFTQNNIPLAGFKTIANGEYYLNASGIMEIGWVQLPGETWYHFNLATGVKDKNWIRKNNTWYYLDSLSGIMKTGWLKDNGSWYYLNNNGAMQTGWIKDESDKWYFLNSDGAMQTGWTNVDGKWYYLYNDGTLAVNTVIDGYRVDESGAWVY